MVFLGDEEIFFEESVLSVVDCVILVFELLYENFECVGVNMFYLLFGFDITGVSSEIEVLSFIEFNCLSVIFEFFEVVLLLMYVSVVLLY